tara:strand:- start:193 stop:540 length:348 start_codon:yes stop_codon:yes gene_type:complete
MKLYSYKHCGTCIKAIRFLDNRSIKYELISIRESPPTISELLEMFDVYGDMKYLFNSSGLDYRQLDLKNKRLSMSKEDQLQLLSSHGNLIKRPFLISDSIKLIGFKLKDWEQLFS